MLTRSSRKLFLQLGLAAMACAQARIPALAEETAAQRGYRWLTTKAYQPDDFSAEIFANLWTIWPEPLRKQAEAASVQERRRMSFSRYGLVEAPGRDGGPPLGAVDTGTGWAMNCLACHGGKIAGQAIPGLGNAHYAFQTLFQDVMKYRLESGETLSATDATGVMVPLGRSNGTTNAQVFSIVLGSMRDDELAFKPGRPMPPFSNHDLDAPPLWLTKRKKQIYIDGFVEKSPRAIMQFLQVPANSGETIRSWQHDFEDVLAWIESLEAPKYPGPVDTALADAGKTVFNQHCAECHGQYGAEADYPERTIPIDEIGTDPVRLRGMPVEHRMRFTTGWLGRKRDEPVEYVQVVLQPEGYVAPPLDGIWASSPYLHNGSIPTLWHLMHAAARPVVWQRTEDGYDHERVGLEVHEMTDLPAEVRRPDEKRQYVDTRLSGKSAAGHTFPEKLDEDEKQAVLEYLKTL